MKKRGPCDRRVKQRKKLRSIKIYKPLAQCLTVLRDNMAACRKSIRNKSRRKRVTLFKACAKKQQEMLAVCVKKNAKEPVYLPPKQVNLVDDTDNQCRPLKENTSLNKAYNKRLIISKTIGENFFVIEALEKRLKAGKSNAHINLLSALKLDKFKYNEYLSSIALKGGKLLFKFNDKLEGNDFDIILTPQLDKTARYMSLHCLVNGKTNRYVLPSICQPGFKEKYGPP